MIYQNPNYKKVRGSRTLLILCGYCKTDIALYQKVGKGSLLRMHIPRIIKSSVDLSQKPQELICPNCKKLLATKITFRKDKEAYKMIRSTYNTKEL